MSSFWILTSVAVGWTALCLLIADVLFGYDRRMGRRINDVALRTRTATTPMGSPLFRDWRVSDERSTGMAVRFHRFLNQTGLQVQPKHVLVVSGWSALAGAVVGRFVIPTMWGVPATVLAVTPFLILSQIRRRRIGQLRSQLPEAFDLMRRAVESGQTVASAFQHAAQQCPNPLARELEFCSEQQKLGLSQDAALRELARRVPIVELNIFVISLIVHRQSGGSPVQILENLSDLIRKRVRLSNRVRALTAEGRMQAIVLTVLPLAAFAGLHLLKPDYIEPLLRRPTLLLWLIAAQVVGAIWVRRTVQLEY